MRNTLLIFLLCFGSQIHSKDPAHIEQIYQQIIPWMFVDFDASMQTSKYNSSIQTTKQIIGIDGNELLNLFRTLYNEYNLSVVQPETRVRIPKIIHQIWLGSDVPEAFEPLMQSWTEMHLGHGWRYKLWTDKDVAAFGLTNQQFYDQTDNFGVKSDLLKWEIVYRYGGVYVDMDYECLRPLDILHYTYDFYVGIQPLDTQLVQLGAALFGAYPGHPILKHCIDTIKDDWHKKGAPSKSGPVHFTRSFFATAGKDGHRDIALPASYMYPLGCKETVMNYDQWIANGAYAIHHWAKSWMPKEFRPRQFRELNNDVSCKSWNN